MNLINPRKYGGKPFNTVVIHGGPGAPGEMAPVARELSSISGVLEPFQTATTIDGQVHELRAILNDDANLSVILIGFSWGALLSYIFTALHPSLVKKLIIIGSGPYEEKYAFDIMETRLNRLGRKESTEATSLLAVLEDPAIINKASTMTRFGELMSRADSYNPLPHDSEVIEYQYDVFQDVWEEASKLRRSGKLLEMGRAIQCPVVAIHGDYDPHPAEGIRKPLHRVIKDFRFILLERCGHMPWIEQEARGRFFDILKKEIL